jgi:hypothetical protein
MKSINNSGFTLSPDMGVHINPLLMICLNYSVSVITELNIDMNRPVPVASELKDDVNCSVPVITELNIDMDRPVRVITELKDDMNCSVQFISELKNDMNCPVHAHSRLKNSFHGFYFIN